MKKIFLFLLFSVSFHVFSQTQINFLFQAKDAQSQAIIALDSISVMNTTLNCDTTLVSQSADETVSWSIENVTWPLGIREISAGGSSGISVQQNYPNPFRGATTITIYKTYSGNMNLSLFDGAGTKLAEYQNNFDKGFHSFILSTSVKGVSVLSVSDDKSTKSIKIINSGQGQAHNSIRYVGQSPDITKGNFKSSEIAGFSFYLGNEMMFTAHANGYTDQTITDNPSADSTYIFNMTLLNLPAVETYQVTGIQQSTATGHGYVTSDGGETVTSRGICWNTTGSPTIEDNATVEDGGTGGFNSTMSGLLPNTLYYVSAYATNSSGTAYGDDVTFKTSLPLLETEAAINDTLLSCYSKLYDYNELLYLFDAVYSNTIAAPDASWTDIYNHAQTADNAKVFMLWAHAYDIIYKTNLVSQSADIVVTDQQAHDQIVAQAKAIKAYLYYNLVNWFGEVPVEPGTAESIIPRNTVFEVLDSVKQYATDASQLLPATWSVNDNFRIPRSFATALLSRAFLYTNQYSEALNATQQIINSGMYALSADTNHFTSAGSEIFWGFAKRNNTVFNDFFTKGSYVPVIRYTESYLISAEANYNLGNTTSALTYVNTLNARRGNAQVVFLTSDEIFHQWNTELMNEGNMFTTLKRFGKALSVVQNFPHKLILPVPMSFIISNVFLTQNAGY